MKAMNRFSKSIAAVAVIGLITAMSACGGSDKKQNAGSNEKSGTVEVWDYEGNGVSNDAMKAAVAAFEKENPKIKIKRTSFAFGDLAKAIVQGGVGGEVPDVAIIDTVDNQNFASLGLLKDITEETKGMKSQFFKGPWSSTQLNGKTYGLPMNSNNLALFYNKTLFKEAGIQNPPTNWAEMADAAKKLASGGRQGLAISGVKNEQGTFQVLPFVWQTGGDLKDYDKSGAKALSYLKDMIDAGSMSSAVANYSQEDARTQFVTGKSAMMVNGPWEISNLKETNFEWGVAPLPKDVKSATGMGGENIVVFEKGKNSAAGLEFVKFMASAKGVQTFSDVSGQLSPRPDLVGKLKLSSDPNMKVFEKQMEITHARSYGKNYPKISELVQLSIQEALTGAKSPDQAAKDAFAKIKPLLP